MKENLNDVTFLILVRLDSIQRLENLIVVVNLLHKYFNTHIRIREAATFNINILTKVLNKSIIYEFVEDKDPVLYKTMHFNEMTRKVNTPYLAIWDADIIPDKKSIIEAVSQLRNGNYSIAYPYNGVCLNISKVMRNLFFKKKDLRFLMKNLNKMDTLYPDLLVGGAVFLNKNIYSSLGMENEHHYGWGNDDFDRYYRFLVSGYTIYRVNKPLFHLMHPRGENSTYHSFLSLKISQQENFKIENSSPQEISKLGKI